MAKDIYKVKIKPIVSKDTSGFTSFTKTPKAPSLFKVEEQVKIKKLRLKLQGLNNSLTRNRSTIRALARQIKTARNAGVSVDGLLTKQNLATQQVDAITARIANLKTKLKELGVG